MPIQFRRGTRAAWLASSQVLADGQPGTARDTGETRVGNGINLWKDLPDPLATIDASYSKVFRIQASPQGWDEAPAINSAIAKANLVGGTVELSEGRHYLDSPLTPLAQGVTLRGKGTLAHLFLHSNYAGGPIITVAGKNVTVRDLQIIGGNTADSRVNPGVGSAINLGSGWRNCTVADIDFNGVNGWCIEGVATPLAGQTYGKGYYGLFFTNLRGENNGGGIHLDSGSTIDHNVQGAISNINLQVCQSASMFRFDTCTDIEMSNIGGCVSGDVPDQHAVGLC